MLEGSTPVPAPVPLGKTHVPVGTTIVGILVALPLTDGRGIVVGTETTAVDFGPKPGICIGKHLEKRGWVVFYITLDLTSVG